MEDRQCGGSGWKGQDSPAHLLLYYIYPLFLLPIPHLAFPLYPFTPLPPYLLPIPHTPPLPTHHVVPSPCIVAVAHLPVDTFPTTYLPYTHLGVYIPVNGLWHVFARHVGERKGTLPPPLPFYLPSYLLCPLQCVVDLVLIWLVW